uniref:Integrase catalytic domain-containing protein n=1 Tax=Strongyloides stercoralis TaxID=6248 RepID=A0A0K0EA93_STRER
MEETFGGMRDFVMVYLDDNIIFGEKKAHLLNIEKILQKLKKVEIKVKLKKCTFLQDKVEFLGYVISKNGIEINSKKVKTTEKLEPLTNRKELRSFLEATNSLRKFILNYAKLASPLTRLSIKFTANSTSKWQGAWNPLEGLLERINIDIRGKLPISKKQNEYLLVIIDDFSKYVLAIPIRNTKAETIINALITQLFTIFGIPK